MDISKILDISASGMAAQSMRLRVIAENMANQDDTGSTPGADPYRRKTITFGEMMGQDGDSSGDGVGGGGDGAVEVKAIGVDKSPFTMRYDPSHPAANADGYVKVSNVNGFVEMMDMREAERSYSADLDVMQTTRGMMTRTIDLLK